MQQDDLARQYAILSQIVYRYLLKLCQNPDIAEELTQETFYRAIKHINKFRGECELATWLCQIAKYAWYKYCKKAKSQTYTAFNELDYQIPDPAPGVEEQCLEKMTIDQFYASVAQLNHELQQIIYLRLMGFSFQEIGDKCGITEHNARIRYFRGMKKLRKNGLI